jgi:hypothetical protein
MAMPQPKPRKTLPAPWLFGLAAVLAILALLLVMSS